MSGPPFVDTAGRPGPLSAGSMLLALLQAARPKQWVKNGFLFAPLVFSRNLFHWDLLARETAAFALFCMVASAVYLANDVLDAPADRAHPVKKHRPVASGRLSPRLAAGTATGLALAGTGLGYLLEPTFGACLAAYLAINAAYSSLLKKLAYVDVVVIASGFVLRVLSGARAIDVPTSEWLFVCTFFLALFLGLGKRKHELLAAQEAGGDGAKARSALKSYGLVWVGRWLTAAGVLAVTSYFLYTVAPETHAKFGSYVLALTLPFPAFGVWRFHTLVSRSARASSPTEALITDVPFVANLALWLASVVAILYGHGIVPGV